jgi:hypothetical protein
MQQAGMDPDAWQETVLRSEAKRLLLLCSRQSGKSTVTAALALHQVVYQPGSLVLLLSPSQRQSVELFRKVLDVYGAIDGAAPSKQESALRLVENGSRLVSLCGSCSQIVDAEN